MIGKELPQIPKRPKEPWISYKPLKGMVESPPKSWDHPPFFGDFLAFGDQN